MLTKVVSWTAEYLQGRVFQAHLFLFTFLQNSPGTAFNSSVCFVKELLNIKQSCIFQLEN